MQYFVHVSCAIRYRSVLLSFLLLLGVFSQTARAQESVTVDQTDSASAKQQSEEDATDASTAQEQATQTVSGETDSKVPLVKPVDMEKWKRRYRRYNTWEGSTGGMHLVDPLSGAAGSVRIQIGIKGFGASDFLVEDDNVESIAQRLTISWTPTEYLELYGSLSNRSVSVDQSDYETRSEDPRFENVFHSLGDASLGLKAGVAVTPLLSFGGDLGLMLPNQPAAVGIQLDAIGISVRGDLALDLRYLEEPFPFVGRFSLDYLFDNSEALIKDTEDKRYDNYFSDDPNPPTRQRDPDHLLTRVERFGMGINRVDLFTLGLGFEIPLQVAEEFYLQPIAEWRMSFPINRGDFVCPYRKTEEPQDESLYPDESCGDLEDASAFPSTLSFGVRGVTPIRGVSAMLGIDIGLTGTSTFVRELKPTAPYEILFAASYDYDARPPDVRIVERKVPVEPPKGRVKGLVTQSDATAATATPISGATIAFIGTDLSPISTGDDGHFVSYDFLHGNKIEMSVSHPDFQTSTCSVEIPPKGGDVEATCPLVPLPGAGEIKGSVTDVWNNGVASATIELSGAGHHTVTTDHDGRYNWPVEPGEYSLRIDAPGYFIRIATVMVAPREKVSRDFILAKKPARSSVTLKGDTIRIKGHLKFDKNTGKIDEKSAVIVTEIADLILRNPQIRKVRIFGSASGASGDTMVALARALNIKHSLVNAGVAPERIEAVGGEQPRVLIKVEQD